MTPPHQSWARISRVYLGILLALLCGAVRAAAQSYPALRAVAAPEGGVRVEWTWVPEPVMPLGWHVERRDSGAWSRITADRVASGLFDGPGKVYRARDARSAAQVGDEAAYRLVVVDPEQREHPQEPVSVVVTVAEDRPVEAQSRNRRAQTAASVARATKAATGPRMKIAVTNEGLFRVTAEQIAEALDGMDAASAAQAIETGQLALTRQGEPVAWQGESGGAALRFFGQGRRDTYDDREFYWLEPGPGLLMAAASRTTAAVAVDPWFWDTTRVERNLYFMPFVPGTAEDDYWVWDGQSVSSPSASWSWSTTVPLADPVLAGPGAQVVVSLISAYNGSPALDNRTRIFAEGQLISDEQWAGDARKDQTGVTAALADSSLLTTVEIRRETGVITTTVLIDAIEVLYPRRMWAAGNRLLFAPVPGSELATVRGFSTPDIQVFDVTDPLRPIAVTATVAQEGAEWRASWTVDPIEPGRFLAVAVPQAPVAMEGVPATGWTAPMRGARHVVIAPRAMTTQAARLVQHRQQQGMESILVPVEDLFDAFTHGRREPEAIRRFLNQAESAWAVPPLYVCLAGDGHLDYHDEFGQAASRPNHIPPLQERVPYNTGPSGTFITMGVDGPLADLDEDGRQDLAIGRLPAQSSSALARMIDRIVAHESSHGWKTRVQTIADKDDEGDFAAAVARLRGRIPSDMSVSELVHSESKSVDTMRAQFIRALNSGALLAVYYGHANNVGISSPYFFEHSYLRSDMSSLTNAVRAPVLVAGSCMLNNFALPHPDNRCLGKGFLDTASGGMAAVWASASESTLAMSELTTEAMLDDLFATQGSMLGDMTLAALDVQAASASPWTVLSSVLLGDPGMLVRTRTGPDGSLWTMVPGDMAVFQPPSGSWNFLSPEGARGTMAFGWSAVKPVPADYDGDGFDDVAVYHPASGNWYIRPSGGGDDYAEAFGWSATIPLPGDYDGDGKADLAVFHRASARWYFRMSGGGADSSVAFGWPAVIPVPADYDGDGAVDVAVYHPASGNWYVSESSTGDVLAVPWGWSTAIPVPGDYDGDGRADIAVFHRASATWFIRFSGGGDLVLAYGWPSVVPVPADYDGDGETDIAVYHEAGGNWYIRQSSDGETAVRALGGSGWNPVLLYSLIHNWFKLL